MIYDDTTRHDRIGYPVAVVQYTYIHKEYRERHKTNNT